MSFWERKTWDPRTHRPVIDGLTIAAHIQPQRNPNPATVVDLAAAEYLTDYMFASFLATLEDILSLPEVTS